MTGFTVYYIVGLPRTGSTFIGDSLARRRAIVNAGEVWQTFRSLGLVEEPGFDSSRGRWARPDERAAKNAEIAGNPFWSRVLERSTNRDPYAALIGEARTRALGLVDSSKTDRGIPLYKALGCRVVVIHTVRGFSSWASSMRSYQLQQSLPVISRARLLLSYLRFNRRMRARWSGHDYHLAHQERIDQLDSVLAFSGPAIGASTSYLRAEMFGTTDFTPNFDSVRSTRSITPLDRVWYLTLRIAPDQSA